MSSFSLWIRHCSVTTVITLASGYTCNTNYIHKSFHSSFKGVTRRYVRCVKYCLRRFGDGDWRHIITLVLAIWTSTDKRACIHFVVVLKWFLFFEFIVIIFFSVRKITIFSSLPFPCNVQNHSLLLHGLVGPKTFTSLNKTGN